MAGKILRRFFSFALIWILIVFFFVTLLNGATVVNPRKYTIDPSNLQTGDIILLGNQNVVGSEIGTATGSKFYHSGIIKIENGTAYIIEASRSDGVVKTSLGKLSYLYDLFEIKRYPYEEVAARAAEIAEEQIKLNLPFDGSFCGNEVGHYCSGLIGFSFNRAHQEINRTMEEIFKFEEIDYTQPFWRNIHPRPENPHRSIAPADIERHRGLSNIEICLRNKVAQYSNYTTSTTLEW
ncbi:MAG: hypothetical protein A2504_13870 [Bdellovibrionales bacterium RIFOXYD12_FULL_39_22]|nr:MAG: hypothetical protein A2385_00595 [Bdellovibrionales bacterium RIFOXYB1_FULL_39_21]OFZ43824.1 MAG: hypothetical protein A2485_04935 [Bdellovibrionales bacterium RIFOXYC12_FULL_39_17]OFZ48842.1 MAG: hypothetical protein A2404_17910 [Bdellovibrionales bacterium RIFOXYC1_FULL_39_130]OFZ76575.1 MAG: hypothetical protein A2560_06575 [Bdellovibrionales bacterium RIFOXYD1_FULL_39_84]OFZ94809.1 MAG: hypothetical protein A2504_13870 [Bdellovibrionales bacterium RIFOXYD12_FULL_39_22]HLE12233.1 Yi